MHQRLWYRWIAKNDLIKHRKQECPNRIVHCKLCNEEGKHSVIVGEHIQTCPNLTLECPNKCKEKVKRKDIEEHRKECPLEIVDCPFKEAGCEVRLPRKHLEKHEASSIQSHLRLNMTTTDTVNTPLANFNTAMAAVSRERIRTKKKSR